MKNDKNLITSFISDRSEQNFKFLYDSYGNNLLKTALYLTKYDTVLSQDLVQDTWITAIEKIDNFQFKSSFKTWITGILINKSREQKRKLKPTVHLEINNGRIHEIGSNLNLAIDLKKAILDLPDGYRTVVTLHDIQGFKHREIAELLDMSVGTSKSQLSHARKVLRDSLKSYNRKNGRAK